MASVAALYRIPDEAQSAKQRAYSLDELKRLVYYSGAPHSVRAATLAALEARGAWPRGDGPATTIICVSLIGMMIDGGCCRSTARRRVKRALKDGFWRKTREANSWTDCPKCNAKRDVGTCANCGYKGDPKNFDEFRRPFTYELDVQKFISHPRCRQIHSVDWRSYQEYKAAAEQGEYPNVTEFPRKPAQPATPTPPLPPSPAAPLPARSNPAAEHRGTERKLPSLTSRQRAELVRRIPIFMKGHTRHTESVGGYGYELEPDDPRYLAPMDKRSAILAACRSMCEGDEAHNLRAHGVSMKKTLEAAADAGFKVETEPGS